MKEKVYPPFKSLRALIVEDNKEFTDLLGILLTKIGITEITTASDFQEAWSAFQKVEPDICLLDVHLKDGQKNGIDLAREIRKIDDQVALIFMTAFFTEENYQQAKVVRPSSFMNKELSLLKLRQAIELAIPSMSATTSVSTPEPDQAPKSQPAKIKGSKFFFRVGDAYKAIDITEISYFYASNKITYARIENQNFPTNVQLKIVEEGLNGRFLRCHKKYLVNQEKITAIKPKEDRIELAGESLPIGYVYRKPFLAGLNLLK